jgi:hypothetical protein
MEQNGPWLAGWQPLVGPVSKIPCLEIVEETSSNDQPGNTVRHLFDEECNECRHPKVVMMMVVMVLVMVLVVIMLRVWNPSLILDDAGRFP